MMLLKILSFFLYPASRLEGFEIVPQAEIEKMGKGKLIIEKMKSRKRYDEYYELTVSRIKVKRALQMLATLLIWLIVVISYRFDILFTVKIGDLIIISIWSVYFIGLSIWVLLRKKDYPDKENFLNMTVKELRLTLRNDLKREWNYIDRQNITGASAYATMSTVVFMFFLSAIIALISAEKQGISLYSYVAEKLSLSCDRIVSKSFNIDFKFCDVFSIPFILYPLFVIIIDNLFHVFTAPPGSGKYYGKQGIVNEFISSVYIDNISLSYLNPSNHETS